MEILALLHHADEVNFRASCGGAIVLAFGSTFSITHDTTAYWMQRAIFVLDVFVYCTQTLIAT